MKGLFRIEAPKISATGRKSQFFKRLPPDIANIFISLLISMTLSINSRPDFSGINKSVITRSTSSDLQWLITSSTLSKIVILQNPFNTSLHYCPVKENNDYDNSLF